jgi:hypothetical protein
MLIGSATVVMSAYWGKAVVARGWIEQPLVAKKRHWLLIQQSHFGTLRCRWRELSTASNPDIGAALEAGSLVAGHAPGKPEPRRRKSPPPGSAAADRGLFPPTAPYRGTIRLKGLLPLPRSQREHVLTGTALLNL